jgi:gliding motility-associated-like protein
MSLEPVHSYHKEGTYRIILVAGIDHGQQDSNGDGVTDGLLACYDTAAMEVTVRDGGYIEIPNAFTPDENGPNGGRAPTGGFNDVFMPIMRGVEAYKMQIFDRWGTKVFETQDPEIGWDGYDRSGTLMKAGVYLYKIEVTLHNGVQDTRFGDVGLIR